MKKFLKNLLIFGLVFFLLDKMLIFFIAVSPGKEADKRLESVITGKINKEIIIVGSSRGARNIIASEIEKKTKFSTFNLSYPGSNIEYHEFMLRTLFKFNKTPKIVLLTMDYPMAFLPDSILNFRLDRFYPLAKYEYINQELVARGEKNLILSHVFALSRMNKSNFDIRQKKFTALDTVFTDGSMPISFQKKNENWEDPAKKYSYSPHKEIKAKLEAFQKIIRMCREKKVRLILISPPLFSPVDNAFRQRLAQLASGKAEFFDYNTQNPIYKDKDYYYDKTHLDRKGALIFTDEIANYLNK